MHHHLKQQQQKKPYSSYCKTNSQVDERTDKPASVISMITIIRYIKTTSSWIKSFLLMVLQLPKEQKKILFSQKYKQCGYCTTLVIFPFQCRVFMLKPSAPSPYRLKNINKSWTAFFPPPQPYVMVNDSCYQGYCLFSNRFSCILRTCFTMHSTSSRSITVWKNVPS